MKITADGDVSFDIHHHHMFAIANGGQCDRGTGIRISRCVQNRVDPTRSCQSLNVIGYRQHAPFDRGVDGRSGFRGNHPVAPMADADRHIYGVANIAYRDAAQSHARDSGDLDRKIRPHLTSPDHTQSDRTPLSRATGEIGQEGRNACDHVNLS